MPGTARCHRGVPVRRHGDVLLPAPDPVVDELADRGVGADHDEHRRRAHAGAAPTPVGPLVVAVEGEQGALELLGDDRLAVDGGVADALLGQGVADPQPEVAVGGPVPVVESSATGRRGTLTMPDSMASISAKSEATQGKSVPSG